MIDTATCRRADLLGKRISARAGASFKVLADEARHPSTTPRCYLMECG